MPPLSATLVSLIAGLSVIGCASIQMKPGRRLDPVGLYSVTEVTIQQWHGSAHRADIYAHPPGRDSLYLGTSSLYLFGQRRYDLVVSPDGRSIVFVHSDQAPKAAALRAGAYRYIVGEGSVFLQAGSHGSPYGDIGLRPAPVPPDVLQLDADWNRADTSWAVTTAGNVLPLILLESDSLHWAAFEGRTDDGAAMVRDGAYLNAPNYWGHTPLDLAIIGGHEETAERLLELGAAVAPGGVEWNRAVDLGRIRVIEAMLKRGLPINATDETGNTMLHRTAAAAIATTGIKGFFTGLATPESRMQSGATERLMRLLLDRGADPNLRNGDALTALDLVTALIRPVTYRPPPRWMFWRSGDRTMETWARETATHNAYLVELQSILKAHKQASVPPFVPQF